MNSTIVLYCLGKLSFNCDSAETSTADAYMTTPYLEISAFDRLFDVRAKLKRASEHIAELHNEVATFVASKPYLIKRELHPHDSKYVVYWIHSTRPLPSSIASRTGDALGNVRAALDNLAHALVSVNGQNPRNTTYFPISDDETKYRSEAPGRVKGMSQSAISMIDGIRPYKEGNVRLWQLHKLNNIHKHRTSLRVGVFCEGISSRTFHLLSPANNIGRILKSGDNLTMLPADLDEDQFLEFAFQVSLNEPTIISYCEPISDTLANILDSVTKLITQFKPLLS